MTPIFGIDCATPIQDAAALRAAGAMFACRYVAPTDPIYDWKRLSRAEALRIHAAGMGLVTVFESGGQRALSGKAGGMNDARTALAQATACGMPKGRPIFFAVDFEVTIAQTPLVVSYIAGAALVLGHAATGVYGDQHAVRACLDAGACEYAWQTYAWSAGAWDVRAHLQQYKNGQTLAGHAVDYNHATTVDYGQWYPPPVRRLVGYTISYLDASGHRQTVDTRAPVLWLARRPAVKARGKVVISRRFTTT